MATLDSTSTLEQIQAAYDDNASYAEDADPAKARTFITACRLLLRRTPASASHGVGSVSMDVGQIRRELEDAKRWLRSRSGGASQFIPDEDFRG